MVFFFPGSGIEAGRLRFMEQNHEYFINLMKRKHMHISPFFFCTQGFGHVS